MQKFLDVLAIGIFGLFILVVVVAVVVQLGLIFWVHPVFVFIMGLWFLFIWAITRAVGVVSIHLGNHKGCREVMINTTGETVEVKIRHDGGVLWINVDGKCVCRVSQIKEIEVQDEREDKSSMDR